MPASRFFAMRRACSEIYARKMTELVDIAMVAGCDVTYYEKIREQHSSRMPKSRRIGKPEVPKQTGLAFSDPQGQKAVRAIFAGLRHFSG